MVEIPFLTDDYICSISEKFLSDYWNSSLPVDIELIAEKNLDLILTPNEFLKQEFDMEALLLGDGTEIVYNRDTDSYRLRFSIAHEIGHLILHSAFVDKLRPTSVEEWENTHVSLSDSLWGRLEYQANAFAGCVLVPRKQLIEEIVKLEPRIQAARKQASHLTQREVLPFILPHLAKRFDVSHKVLEIEIERRGIDVFDPIQN
jgi:Zn-dependent peptidase ImmA (M78 family)